MPRNRVPVMETLIVTQLVKKYLVFYGTRRSTIACNVRVLVVAVLVQVKPVHTLPPSFLRIMLISFSHLRLCLKVVRVAQSIWLLATCWTVRGSNPDRGEIFRTCPDRSWGPPSLLYNGYRVFLGGKERPWRDAEPSPPSSAVVYSPHGPYGLYRASVPVQYSYTSTPPMGRTACTEPQCLYSRAIPLLPLWTVRPVQSLGACTVQLYLYSPYGPYGLYRGSVPVQGWPLPFISKRSLSSGIIVSKKFPQSIKILSDNPK